MGKGWKWVLGWVFLGLTLLVAAVASGFLAMRYTMRKEISTIPALTGLKIQDAEILLARLGLKMEIAKTQPSASTPIHCILSQHPAEGTPIKVGQTVSVIVSSGKMQVPIPDLTGTSLRVAEIQLSQAGFRLGRICLASLGESRPSEVVRQSASSLPAEDSLGAVDLLVNTGKPDAYYLMPDLKGKEINEAVQLFAHVSLPIKEVRYLSSPGVRKGMILNQDPPAGSRLGAKDTIRIQASK